jgi:hypothetical protein
VYKVVSVIPVSRDSAATDRLCGGIIRFNTDAFSSIEYLDISRHLAPPASNQTTRRR